MRWTPEEHNRVLNESVFTCEWAGGSPILNSCIPLNREELEDADNASAVFRMGWLDKIQIVEMEYIVKDPRQLPRSVEYCASPGEPFDRIRVAAFPRFRVYKKPVLRRFVTAVAGPEESSFDTLPTTGSNAFSLFELIKSRALRGSSFVNESNINSGRFVG